MGRRLTTRLPDNTIWQQHYDAQGRLAAQKDPLGGQRRVIYDATGRAIAQIEADGSQQRVTYDAAGRISALTLGNGAIYHFTYDVMDRVIQEVSPDGRDQRFEYDAAGQQIARTEMNRPGPDGQPLVTRYIFDTNGRLIERWLPATAHAPECCEVYGWLADGQMVSADNAYSEVLFTYDETGRVAGEQQRHYDTPGTTATEAWQWQTRHRFTETGAPAASQFGGLPEFTWLTYGSGHLLGINAPDLGLEVTFKTDALHRETLRRFSLADHGTALEGKTPQPLVLERGYTLAGQITHLTLQGSEIDSPHQQFDYDALGRMSTRQLKSRPENRGNRSDGLVIDYSFDAAGRLTGSRHGDEQQHYPMDAAGNRLDNRKARMDATLSDNRIHHLHGTNYRYDGAGNLIERQRADGEQLSLGYDGANRLVHLVRTDARGETTEVVYRYDPLGRRIAKIIDAPGRARFTTHYGWDGDRLVHEDSPAQPATTVVYEPGSFVPMLRLDEDAGEILFSAYVTDALGTPMQLLALDGTVRWQARPHDWAAVQDERGTTSQSIRFQGQWQDEESGLYYNRHRYYDPQAGRYITQDPIGLRGGENLYGYVDNPTSMVDPMGLTGAEGQVLTGGSYKPGIGAFFPSSASAFARSPQDKAALSFQGATRNNLSLPAASGALAAPMIAPRIPAAASATVNTASALVSGANNLSLQAMCSLSRVSPSAAVQFANATPAIQSVALDIVESALPGPPSPNASGVVGYAIGSYFSPEESMR